MHDPVKDIATPCMCADIFGHSGVFGDYRMDDADRTALHGADRVFCT